MGFKDLRKVMLLGGLHAEPQRAKLSRQNADQTYQFSRLMGFKELENQTCACKIS